jgi:hypothetical protein
LVSLRIRIQLFEPNADPDLPSFLPQYGMDPILVTFSHNKNEVPCWIVDVLNTRKQCCGSRWFLGPLDLDSDTLLRGTDPALDPSKKNLDSYCSVTFYDFLSLKNDVNVPSKSEK